MMSDNDSSSAALETLHGEKLSSVEFCLDVTIQLHFDGHLMTVYGGIAVEDAQRRWELGAPGFRDALCARIGQLIVGSHIEEDRYLALSFADASVIEVNLDPELLDEHTPEHVIFDLSDHRWWVW